MPFLGRFSLMGEVVAHSRMLAQVYPAQVVAGGLVVAGGNRSERSRLQLTLPGPLAGTAPSRRGG